MYYKTRRRCRNASFQASCSFHFYPAYSAACLCHFSDMNTRRRNEDRMSSTLPVFFNTGAFPAHVSHSEFVQASAGAAGEIVKEIAEKRSVGAWWIE
jgi:hypothetical protein